MADRKVQFEHWQSELEMLTEMLSSKLVTVVTVVYISLLFFSSPARFIVVRFVC